MDNDTREAFIGQLEDYIDRTSLAEVLELIAEIADGKAEHLSGNWHDEKSGREWQRAARNLMKVVDGVAI